jgi:NADH-quinone oxidoreductase subunit D
MMYMLEAREFLYDLIEAVTGARLTVTWCRVGGMTYDLPHDFVDRMKASFVRLDQVLSDCDQLLSRNRVFIDRMADIGIMSKEDAISYGLSGPLLRAVGVSYDVRKAHPYLVYDRMDFEVPIGERGDNYDRFNVRFREMHQSKRIIEQALASLPEGPVSITDPKVVLPPKERVYNSIEGLMNHFKLIMEGIHVPAGEIYQAVEGGNGELGFYVVSDGSGRPYRVRVRPPCFMGMGALNKMLIGRMIADIITTFGMINMIGGECDR